MERARDGRAARVRPWPGARRLPAVPPGLPDHLFFLVLTVVVPLRARLSLRRLLRAEEEDLPRVRLRSYRLIVLVQWTLAALLLLLWRLTGRSGSALGLVPRLNGGTIGVVVGIL